MNQIDPWRSHGERDHDYLVRPYAKAAEMFVDDAWSWAERELAELKGVIDFVDALYITGAAKERLAKLGQRVNDINLKYLKDALNLLSETCKQVKTYNYVDALEAVMQVQQAEGKLLNLMRELIWIRGQVDAINESFGDEDED